MSTTYVDINARNSILENDTNNIFEYQLPEAVSLPAGTNISVQNALINLQGINGASIEITKQFVFNIMSAIQRIKRLEVWLGVLV